jgi:hypothetical protein
VTRARVESGIVELLDQLVDENTSALLARWLLQRGERPDDGGGSNGEGPAAADNVLCPLIFLRSRRRCRMFRGAGLEHSLKFRDGELPLRGFFARTLSAISVPGGASCNPFPRRDGVPRRGSVRNFNAVCRTRDR